MALQGCSAPSDSADDAGPVFDDNGCRLFANGEDPAVLVGIGEFAYDPTEELEVAQVAGGPQGGHHVWVAVRQQNLRESGSTTSVSGRVPELELDMVPISFLYDYARGSEGYCDLVGLQFQLDFVIDIDTILDRVLDISVQVSDADGSAATGTKSVTLSHTKTPWVVRSETNDD